MQHYYFMRRHYYWLLPAEQATIIQALFRATGASYSTGGIEGPLQYYKPPLTVYSTLRRFVHAMHLRELLCACSDAQKR